MGFMPAGSPTVLSKEPCAPAALAPCCKGLVCVLLLLQGLLSQWAEEFAWNDWELPEHLPGVIRHQGLSQPHMAAGHNKSRHQSSEFPCCQAKGVECSTINVTGLFPIVLRLQQLELGEQEHGHGIANMCRSGSRYHTPA